MLTSCMRRSVPTTTRGLCLSTVGVRRGNSAWTACVPRWELEPGAEPRRGPAIHKGLLGLGAQHGLCATQEHGLCATQEHGWCATLRTRLVCNASTRLVCNARTRLVCNTKNTVGVQHKEHDWCARQEHGWCARQEHGWCARQEHGWCATQEHGWCATQEHGWCATQEQEPAVWQTVVSTTCTGQSRRPHAFQQHIVHIQAHTCSHTREHAHAPAAASPARLTA